MAFEGFRTARRALLTFDLARGARGRQGFVVGGPGCGGAAELFVALRQVEERADTRIEFLAVGELLTCLGILARFEQLSSVGEELLRADRIGPARLRMSVCLNERSSKSECQTAVSKPVHPSLLVFSLVVTLKCGVATFFALPSCRVIRRSNEASPDG